MAERVTEAQLRSLIGALNRECGYPEEPYSKNADGNGYHPNANVYHLDIAYGGYRLAQMSSQEGCTGTCDVSPRLSKRELFQWIRAYSDGLRLGKSIHK